LPSFPHRHKPPRECGFSGRVNEVLRNGRTIQAWNLWREGKRVSEKNLNYTPLSDDYPKIV
jgi:hypothetical protein